MNNQPSGMAFDKNHGLQHLFGRVAVPFAGGGREGQARGRALRDTLWRNPTLPESEFGTQNDGI
jgi:hypothetical protein